MDDFTVGQTVRITASAMKGMVGTVVHLDEKQGKYLVRVGGAQQNYFTADELELFTA